MFTVGVAIVVADVALLSVEVGVQLYADPPVAESCTDVLLQMVVSFDRLVIGAGCTATFTVSFAVQPLLAIPSTIYCVLAVGVAIGLPIEGFESPADGVQEYVCAPVAVKFTDAFAQIAVSPIVRTKGVSITIFTESLLIMTGAKEISSSAKSLPEKIWF